jgi:hypothetical protein
MMVKSEFATAIEQVRRFEYRRVQRSSEPEIMQACNSKQLYCVKGTDRRRPLTVWAPIICYSCDDVSSGRRTNLKQIAALLVSISSVTIKTNIDGD